jgi:hypothetical protein
VKTASGKEGGFVSSLNVIRQEVISMKCVVSRSKKVKVKNTLFFVERVVVSANGGYMWRYTYRRIGWVAGKRQTWSISVGRETAGSRKEKRKRKKKPSLTS